MFACYLFDANHTGISSPTQVFVCVCLLYTSNRNSFRFEFLIEMFAVVAGSTHTILIVKQMVLVK